MQAEVARLSEEAETAAAEVHRLRAAARHAAASSGCQPRQQPCPAAAGRRPQPEQQSSGSRQGLSTGGGGGGTRWGAQPADEDAEMDEVLLEGDSAEEEQREPEEALASEFAARARAGLQGRAGPGAGPGSPEPGCEADVDITGGSEDEEEGSPCAWDEEEEARLLAVFQDTAVEAAPSLADCPGAGAAAPTRAGAAPPAKENQPPRQRRPLKRLYQGDDGGWGAGGAGSRSRLGQHADDNLACSQSWDGGDWERPGADAEPDPLGSWGWEARGAGAAGGGSAGRARAGQLLGGVGAASRQPPGAGSGRQGSGAARSDSGSGLQVRAHSRLSCSLRLRLLPALGSAMHLLDATLC